MGACHSCKAAGAASTAATAKVVLSDGGLREYASRVTAGSVLGKDADCFFVCDADEMEIEGFVSAMGAEALLRTGQLYFVLPRAMLKHPRPLQVDDLAALAAKASAALMERCGKEAVEPLVFPEVDLEEEAGDQNVVEKRWKTRSGSGRGRKFALDLSVIPE